MGGFGAGLNIQTANERLTKILTTRKETYCAFSRCICIDRGRRRNWLTLRCSTNNLVVTY